MKSSCAVLACLLLAYAVPTHGQGGAGAPVFRSSADLVALNVIATDGQKRFVADLASGDFAVFEDGVLQDVSFFAAGDAPLDLAILLDTSASMLDKMEIMQRAALGFAQTLRPDDRAMVVDIKDSTRVIHTLDAGIDGVGPAIKTTAASGGTGLYNALYLAFRELQRAQRPQQTLRRQAIVVLSDGLDTKSLMTFEDVMEVARQSGIAAYTITLRAPELTEHEQTQGSRFYSRSDYMMRSLSQETGGEAYFPLRINELAGVYQTIAKELASQYALGYMPKSPRFDGSFRKIQVRVADRPDIRVRTRAGYTARRSSSGTLE